MHEKCISFPYISILSLIHFTSLHFNHSNWTAGCMHCQRLLKHLYYFVDTHLRNGAIFVYDNTYIRKCTYHFTIYQKRDKMHDQNPTLIPIICIVCRCHTETMDAKWKYGMVINQSDLFSLHRIKKHWIFIGWILKVHLMYIVQSQGVFLYLSVFCYTFLLFRRISMNGFSTSDCIIITFHHHHYIIMYVAVCRLEFNCVFSSYLVWRPPCTRTTVLCNTMQCI